MPETVVDLGKKVKAKYPGQYDDLGDAEVGARVKAKFPGAYDDFADVASPSNNAAILAQQAAKYPTAAEQGGKAGSVAPTPNQGPEDSPILRAIYGFGRGASTLIGAAGQAIESARNPVGTGVTMAGQAAEQYLQGKNAPTNTEAAGHYLASALPVVGPYAASLGERIGSGDIAGGLAEAATVIGGPKLAEKGLTALRNPASAPATARDIYRSALKPSTTLPVDKVNTIVNTGLEQGIPISEEGIRKLDTLVQHLNSKIDAKVKGSTATISPKAVASRLGQTQATFENQVTPAADLEALDAAKNEFLAKHQTTGQQYQFKPTTNPITNQTYTGIQEVGPSEIPLSAEEAQNLKKGTYRQLKDKSFGELKGAQVEAQKALARGLKEELAKQVPELADLNASEGKLLDLDGVLERAVNRAANANKGGRLGPLIAGGVAKSLTGSSAIGAAAGIMKVVLDDPEFASRLAITLYKTQKTNPAVAASIYAKVGALSAAVNSASRTNADSSGKE